MKICFICNEYPPGPHGGLGSLVKSLAQSMTARGHQVYVVGIYPKNYPSPDREDGDGVQIWRLRESAYHYGWVLDRLKIHRVVVAWAKQSLIDLIEIPDYEGWAAGWGKLSIPVVARLNGSGSVLASERGQSVRRFGYLLEKMSLLRADHIISASKHIAKRTHEVFRLHRDINDILYNPVHLPISIENTQRSRNKVIFSGTINENKGILSLLKAWRIVKSTRIDAELHLLGKFGKLADGSPIQDLIKYELEHQKSLGIQFHGFVDRKTLVSALQTATVAVYPSFFESFGLAPVEAMAYGCPTIFTKNASGPEIINHGMDGLLIDPDSPADIAKSILEIMNDEPLALKLGTQARQKVYEKFSFEKIIPLNESYYRYCLEQFTL